MEEVRALLARSSLHTVCQSAHCPNIFECFSRGTATFLILGPNCTRQCGFCAVGKGDPRPVDGGEPERVAEAVAALGLDYVVVTSVTRDDLADGGAGQFVRTIAAARRRTGARVEVLVPDFAGNWDALDQVVAERPDVLNHNVETVPALYEQVRPGASYERSLELLLRAREGAEEVVTKSGLMVGLGESREQIAAVLRDLREVGCEVVTIGQYLAPSAEHLPVARFVPPEEFEELADEARELGFRAVSSGPFVRSSHGADRLFASMTMRE
jgi:lipoic acid synthetase